MENSAIGMKRKNNEKLKNCQQELLNRLVKILAKSNPNIESKQLKVWNEKKCAS